MISWNPCRESVRGCQVSRIKKGNFHHLLNKWVSSVYSLLINVCRLSVLLLSATNSQFKWIFFLCNSPQRVTLRQQSIVWASCNSIVLYVLVFRRVPLWWWWWGGGSTEVLASFSQEQINYWECVFFASMFHTMSLLNKKCRSRNEPKWSSPGTLSYEQTAASLD